MGWRALGFALGCAGVAGASAAFSWQYFGQAAVPAAPEPSAPAFVTAALQAEPRSAWPPSGPPVAFHDEMTALLTWGAEVSAAARDAVATRGYAMANPPPPPAREQARTSRKKQARGRNEQPNARTEQVQTRTEQTRTEQTQARTEQAQPPGTVDIQVRDRHGRIVETRRVQRERPNEPPQAYAPPPRPSLFGPFLGGDW